MTVDIALVVAALGVLLPLVNALVVHVQASPVLKSGVAVLLAALGSVLTWATGVTGNVSIKQLVIVAVGALIAAGGQRVSWLSNVEQLVAQTLPGGLGNPNKPAGPPVPSPLVVTPPAA